MAPLRVLIFTSLYPSEARPRHGIFVETRLMQLLRDFDVDARVIAPVPWFPFRSAAFGAYARFAATPRRALRHNGLQVSHPRYLMIPRFGVRMQPDVMARAAMKDVDRLLQEGWRPQLVDAHYLYPDGVAAQIVADRLGVPFVMTARGTDVNVLAHMPGPGGRIIDAARASAAVITVSSGLRDQLVSLGVEPAKITVLRNGVDLDVFGPGEQGAARTALGLVADGPLAVSVGNLVPEKGQALAVEALRDLPDLRLVVVGDGPQREALVEIARGMGVADRVQIRAPMPQVELRRLYNAADVLLLTSTREGWPNVVLEAMACGTPVVAFDVGAVPEMITEDAVGRIVRPRSPQALAAAVRDVLSGTVERGRLTGHAAQFDWSRISRGQWDLFQRVVGSAAASGRSIR